MLLKGLHGYKMQLGILYKKNARGVVVCFKIRLVVKGCLQMEGVDFWEPLHQW